MYVAVLIVKILVQTLSMIAATQMTKIMKMHNLDENY